MARKITAKGGPLNGKTFTVHDTADTFTHHAAPGGHYKITEKQATWTPDKAGKSEDQ